MHEAANYELRMFTDIHLYKTPDNATVSYPGFLYLVSVFVVNVLLLKTFPCAN